MHRRRPALKRVMLVAMLLPWALVPLLAPAVAGPAYWWLHVRPDDGEPHGLQTLRPARAWAARTKWATGAGAVASLVFFALWSAWLGSFFLEGEGEAAAVPAFGLWTLVTCAVVGLFVLDALREGGRHAIVWTIVLVVAWAPAA